MIWMTIDSLALHRAMSSSLAWSHRHRRLVSLVLFTRLQRLRMLYHSGAETAVATFMECRESKPHATIRPKSPRPDLDRVSGRAQLLRTSVSHAGLATDLNIA